jgi:hypothetical protein
MDHLALHADPFAVNYPRAFKTFLMGQLQVFLDQAFHVARRDGMKIEDVRNLDFHWFREGVVKIIFVHKLFIAHWCSLNLTLKALANSSPGLLQPWGKRNHLIFQTLKGLAPHIPNAFSVSE